MLTTPLIPTSLARYAVAAATLFLSACATTDQADSVTATAFLASEPQLGPGQEGEPLLIWKAESLDIGSFDAVYIRPIDLALEPESAEGLESEDAERLTRNLREMLATALEPDLLVVDAPGPNTIELRVALTEARRSCVFLDAVSTISPYGLAASAVVDWTTGCRVFIGSATVEAELRGPGGEPLLQIVDRRRGRKSISGVFDSFDDVEESFAVWSGQLRDWLRCRRERSQAATI